MDGVEIKADRAGTPAPRCGTEADEAETWRAAPAGAATLQ
jgi:hypothetical protein